MLIHKNSITDARTPQPGEIVFNTMIYRSRKQYRDRDTFKELSIIYNGILSTQCHFYKGPNNV